MEAPLNDWVPEGTVRIPLLGSVAAGQPLEVFTVEETLAVPESLWHGRKIFALRVRGNSMIDAGIHDGDYLIVDPRPDADDGRTVVAEVDGRVTVKKLHRDRRGQVRLQPANSAMLPLIIGGDRVKIVGVVIGVLRKYGFGRAGTGRPPAPARPAKTLRRAAAARGPLDDATLELAVNAIDAQLDRWKQAVADAQRRGAVRDLAAHAELARDLQALRDWCARTTKPALRRALIAEATGLMQRMDRLLACTPALGGDDATLH